MTITIYKQNTTAGAEFLTLLRDAPKWKTLAGAVRWASKRHAGAAIKIDESAK